ncbi:MAG: peptide/nickel transport system substrate-binding protein [Thermomicrobiales bacterium]|nr:peptide/nickel transport system substrate-binding protein [Thermomicrobiales bacterium]
MHRPSDDLDPATDRNAIPSSIPESISRRDLIHLAAAIGAGGASLHALRNAAPAGAQPLARPGRPLQRLAPDPKTLTLALDGSPSDLDPHSCYDYRSSMAILGPYEPLIGLVGEKTDEYEGILAESWEANEDKSVWTFHLRDGVTFQDGTPLDAEAVRLSFERFLTLGLGPVNVLSRFVADPKQITTPDAKTVVFDCGRPQPLFETAIASTYGVLVVNAKALKEHEEDGDWGHVWAQTNAEGTGTGAYKIVEFAPDQQLVMDRNENYWRGWDGDHFDRIVFRVVTEVQTRRQLLEQGEADLADDLTAEDRAALRQNPDLVIHQNLSTQVNYFTMTVAGPLEKPEARQALCWAFPYQAVIDGVYGGDAKQAAGAVAEMIRGFDPNTFKYTTDLEKARQLLSQAGVEEGTKLTVLLESGVEVAKNATELLQANLTEIGITLEIQTVDLTAFTATFYGDAPAEERPNLMWWGWWPDYNDAWNHLYPQVSCDAWGSKGSNGGFYCNQQVEDLLTQARDAPDLETYQQVLSEIQQILSRDDPPSIYYVQPLWTSYVRKDIAGFVYNPINIGTFNFWRMSRTV